MKTTPQVQATAGNPFNLQIKVLPVLVVLAILCAVPLASGWAKPVSVDTATMVATRWYREVAGKPASGVYLADVKRSAGKDSEPLLYCFASQEGGEIIVTADDSVWPVLFYTLESFPEGEGYPPQMAALLDEAALIIGAAQSKGVAADTETLQEWRRLTLPEKEYKNTDLQYEKEVSPLLKVTWDQGQYYNAQCPEDTGGPDGRVLVGCVAVAMGQIMKYHEYPRQGFGSHKYLSSFYGWLSADFGAATYQWENMPDALNYYNDDVAELLFHCGIAVEMEYGPYSSGATSSMVVYGIREYFSYTASEWIPRSSYGNDEWLKRIRENLDADLPVYYDGAGVDYSGGHAFVLDGYQREDYFHVNWGWGGWYDGYFYLDALTPGEPGDANFSFGQGAIFDIKPDACRPDEDPPILTLLDAVNDVCECGIPYEDPGATAVDGCDGNLTAQIRRAGEVYESTVGEYTLIYTVSDSSANEAVPVTRRVTVADNTPPKITLNGEEKMAVLLGGDFEDPGAVAVDACGDIDLTASIVRQGSVDVSAIGVYALTYQATDNAGNTGKAVRTVTVSLGSPPVITLLGGDSMFVECGVAFMDPGVRVDDPEEDGLSDAIETDSDLIIEKLGTYTIRYNVTDSQGNIARTVSRNVTVQDSTPPMLTLMGDAYMEVEADSAFTDPGAVAEDSCGNVPLSDRITISGGPVNTTIPNTYTLTYQVTDDAGNTAEKTRTVRVWKDEAPVITLKGASPLDLECGGVFADPGATAMDIPDGNLSTSIEIGGDTVDTHAPGSYSITYDVTDSGGKTAVTVTRVVTVIDTHKPEITLLGANPMNIEYGETYVDPGATALDACDGDLSGSIVTGGDTVNTTVSRTYKVRYTVADHSANEDTVIRQVTVLARVPVTVPDLSNMTVEQAEAMLAVAKLTLGVVTEQYHSTLAVGHIISQNPKAGSSALSGHAVTVTISKGPQEAVEGEEFPEGENEIEGESPDEGEGEEPLDDEGEEEEEEEEKTPSGGCFGAKQDQISDTWKNLLGDYLLLGLALMMLLGMRGRNS